MRPQNSAVSKYRWYDSTMVDGVFTLHESEDTHVCIFCHNHAPSSIYFPLIEDDHRAPPNVQRMRARVCNNHYQGAKRLVEKSVFPVTFEIMYERFRKKASRRNMATIKLPGWRFDQLSNKYSWGPSTVDTAAFMQLYEYSNETGLLFLQPDNQVAKFNEFAKANPHISLTDMKIFERYLYNKGDYAMGLVAKSTSGATMFD